MHSGQDFADASGFVTELEDYIHGYNHERIWLTLERLSPREDRGTDQIVRGHDWVALI